MIAEMVILSQGWTVEYILSMPTKRFFALQKSLREVDYKRHAFVFKELCDVVFITNAKAEYADKLKEHYKKQITPPVIRTRKGLSLNDPYTFRAFSSIFIQKKKLMGLQ